MVVFFENPQNGQCSGHCGLKMASGERVKVLANEDTLLPTQMFPGLPAHATFETIRFCAKSYPVFEISKIEIKSEEFAQEISSCCSE